MIYADRQFQGSHTLTSVCPEEGTENARSSHKGSDTRISLGDRSYDTVLFSAEDKEEFRPQRKRPVYVNIILDSEETFSVLTFNFYVSNQQVVGSHNTIEGRRRNYNSSGSDLTQAWSCNVVGPVHRKAVWIKQDTTSTQKGSTK